MSKEEAQTKAQEEATETEAVQGDLVDEPVEEASTEEPAVEADSALAAAQEALQEKEDALLRAQAEIQNIQTRNARELANIRKYDGQKLAEAILPVVDNLERALAIESDGDAQVDQVQKGVAITLKTLKTALEQQGIQPVGQVGEAFDPNSMQGVQTVPATDDLAADQVAEVLQKGYLLHDRVIRPAMVVVAQ
ncbi:nucleotide exchange factor GrpE [Leuconostocaceae bacterium ESL0958]|nr:nucleotide exchange factor GrpE [Leuconostocaceae bacterium ESL0958]